MSSSQMHWSYDYCLSCDRQIAESGAYCSQSCRLADLEKAGNRQTASRLSSSASSSSSSNNGFYLPPAVNFSAYRTASSSRGFDCASSSSYHYSPTANGTCFAPPTTSQLPRRSLTPSSSRSSLVSSTPQSQSGISQTAATQLNNYMRQFDQTRDMKRRLTQY